MADLLFYLFRFSYFACVELATDLLAWSNINQSNRRSAVQWYFHSQSKWVFSALGVAFSCFIFCYIANFVLFGLTGKVDEKPSRILLKARTSLTSFRDSIINRSEKTKPQFSDISDDLNPGNGDGHVEDIQRCQSVDSEASKSSLKKRSPSNSESSNVDQGPILQNCLLEYFLYLEHWPHTGMCLFGSCKFALAVASKSRW